MTAIENSTAATNNLESEAPSFAEAREWARSAEEGDYLVKYSDVGSTPDGDPGSRCGFGDDELAEIGRILEKRGLCLSANDRGLVAGAGK